MRPVLLLALALGFLFDPAVRVGAAPAAPPAASVSATDAAQGWGKLPLAFVPNRGQSDPAARFEIRDGGGALFFSPEGVALALPTPADDGAAPSSTRDGGRHGRGKAPLPRAALPAAEVRLRFEGADKGAEPRPGTPLPGVANYLRGDDPARWRTGLPTYAGIVYEGLYPGIDLAYDGTGGRLKGTYTVAPGADPGVIRWRYQGAADPAVDPATGALTVALPGQRGRGGPALVEDAPVAWQERDGGRTPVDARFELARDGGVGFALGAYDPALPLIIDPTLTYSTYLGSGGDDGGNAIAVDATGAAYVAGATWAADFPTKGPAQGTWGGEFDAFVTKINPAGTALVYSTYLGGSNWDLAHGIAVDSAGRAAIVGSTDSANFPTTAGGYDTSHGGGACAPRCWDVFVAQLAPDGASLRYGTLLGGTGAGDDEGLALATDGTGKLYATGYTVGSFPTKSAFDTSYNGGDRDSFAAKLDPALTGNASLIYSTYLGGDGEDLGWGIAVDGAGRAAVVGRTDSSNYPTTAGGYDTSHGGGPCSPRCWDAYLTQLNANGAGLRYSTLLGGTGGGDDEARAVAVDGAGRLSVTGDTFGGFPTQGAYDASHNGDRDGFVAGLDPAATGSASFLFGTYLGGAAADAGRGIALGGTGVIYVTGYTYATNFPTADAPQGTKGADNCTTTPCADAFATALAPDGATLRYSTYLGGGGEDVGNGIAVDGAGAAYVTGKTGSTNLPTTPGTYDPSDNALDDAFVIKIGPPGTGPAQTGDVTYTYDPLGRLIGVAAATGSGPSGPVAAGGEAPGAAGTASGTGIGGQAGSRPAIDLRHITAATITRVETAARAMRTAFSALYTSVAARPWSALLVVALVGGVIAARLRAGGRRGRGAALRRRLGLLAILLVLLAAPDSPLLPALVGAVGLLGLLLVASLLADALLPGAIPAGLRARVGNPRLRRASVLARRAASAGALVALVALVVVAGLGVLARAPRAAAFTNPVVNPSFVSGGGGWFQDPNAGCFGYGGLLYDGVGHDGTGGAGKLQHLGYQGCDPPRHDVAEQTITVPANVQAKLSLWYRGSGVRNGTLRVGLTGVGHGPLYGIPSASVTPATPWTRLESRVLNLPAGTYYLRISAEDFGFDLAPVDRSILIDEVALEEVVGPPARPGTTINPLANPTFEQAGGVGYGWEVAHSSSCAAQWGAGYADTGHDSTGGAGRLFDPGVVGACDPQRTSVLAQNFTLAADALAPLSFWYRGGGIRDGTLRARLDGPGGAVLVQDLAVATTTPWTAWTSPLLTLPAGAYRLTFSVSFPTDVGYFDRHVLVDEAKIDLSYNALHNGSPCSRWTEFAADPVNTVFGTFVSRQRDFGSDGPGLPLDLTRSYNSADKSDIGFGVGWTHPYGASVTQETSGTAIVRNADCRRDRFTGTGVGNWAAPPGIDNALVKNADGTWTLTTPARVVSTFDANGRLTGMQDRFNNAVGIAYTAGGMTVTNPAGKGFALAYGTGANASRFVSLTEVGGLGRTVGYGYSAAGDLTGVTDARAGLTQMTYDANHQLLTLVDPQQQTAITNVYDASGRVIEQRDAQNKKMTLTYDPVARQTVHKDHAGAVIATYGWDAAARVPTIADGGSNTTGKGYDANKRLVCLTDPASGKTGYGYDAAGNVTSIIDPLNTDASCALKAGGVRTTITYNAANQPLVITDPLGHTTTYGYDAQGYLTSAKNHLNQTTTYGYVTVNLTAGGTTRLVQTVTDPLTRATTYAYNGLGRVISITNALSQVTALEYDAAGRLTKITPPGGISECREYDNANNLTAVVQNCVAGQSATVERNVRTEYGYDGNGQPTWTRGPTGEVTRTVYDSRALVDKTIAGCFSGGAYSTTTCDPFDAAHPERNRVTTYAHDDRGRQATVTDPLGVTARVEYDPAGRPFKTTANYVQGGPTNASTNVATTTEYDAAGRVTATIDPLGRKTLYRYDLAGRQYETVRNYVDGNPATGSADSDLVTRVEYDAAGRATATIENYVDGAWDPAKPAEDNKTVTVYDVVNRPIKTIAHYVDGVSGAGEPATDLISETLYDAAGNVMATIDPLGRVTVTAYDAINRPTTTTRNCTDGAGVPRTSNCAAGHGAGNDQNLVATTAYTTRGLVDYTLDPAGRKTAFAYDGLGRALTRTANVAGTVAPANVVTSYTYDAAGRILTMTDPLGKVWATEYDGAGRAVRQVDPTNRATRQTYDAGGRPVGAIDAGNRERRVLYDPLGRATATIINWQNGTVEPNDGADLDLITASEYDAAGRRTAQVAPDGVRTAYAFDGLGRLTGVTENQGGSVAPANVTTSYGYDRRGLLTAITDPRSNARGRAYDAAGRQTSETDGLSRATTFTYDRAGRQVTKADPRPVTVTYGYDLADRRVSTSATGLTTIALAYDLAGRRASMADETGTTTYGYDGLDRTLTAAHTVTGTVSHGWDAAGRRTSLGTSTGAPAITYLYDDAGRTTEVKRAGVLHAAAAYDGAGRLETVTRAGGIKTAYAYDGADRTLGLRTTATNGTVLADFRYRYNRVGQVVWANESTRGYGYGYDPAGNRTGASLNGTPTEARTYDAADQVTGQTYDGAGNLTSDGTRTYTYDPLGRLKTVAQGGTTTTYGYDGDGILASRASGGTTTRYTTDTQGGLPERLGATTGSTSTWYVRGLGQELSRESGGTTAWLVADRIGSVRAALNTAGSVTARHAYDPYGTPLTGTGLSVPADFGYTGEPHDTGTGLVHLRARWYVPATGQFLGRDPWQGDQEEPQSFNPYAYAHNDPVNGTDPTGMFRAEVGAGGGGWASGLVDKVLDGISALAGAAGGVTCPSPGGGTLLLAVPPGLVASTAGAIVRHVPTVLRGAAIVAGGAAVLAGATGVVAACLATVVCPIAITFAGITLLVLVVGSVAAPERQAAPPAQPVDEQGRPVPAPAPPPVPSPPPGPVLDPTLTRDRQPLYLFHYTDAEGYAGILMSGRIRPSIRRPGVPAGTDDAAYGNGVYLTDLLPTGLLDQRDYALALFFSNSLRSQGKVQFWIQVEVSSTPAQWKASINTRHIKPESLAASLSTFSVYLVPTEIDLPVRIVNDGPTIFR